jgi:hypothetical protein
VFELENLFFFVDRKTGDKTIIGGVSGLFLMKKWKEIKNVDCKQ